MLSNPAVDGTFTDDVQGLPEEHSNAPVNIGMSSKQLYDLQLATQV